MPPVSRKVLEFPQRAVTPAGPRTHRSPKPKTRCCNWLDRSLQSGVGIGGVGNGGDCLVVNGAERMRNGAFGPSSMGFSHPCCDCDSSRDGGGGVSTGTSFRQLVSVPAKSKQGQLGCAAGKTAAFSKLFFDLVAFD